MRAEPFDRAAEGTVVADSKLAADRSIQEVGGVVLILGFLGRYWRWLVVSPLLFGVLAVAYQEYLVHPLFEATALVAIGPNPKAGAFVAPKVSPAGYSSLAETVQIFDSTNRELRRSGLLPAGAELVRKQMGVELAKVTKGSDANTALLHLTYWGESDERAVEAVNAWGRVLVNFNRRKVQRAQLKWALADARQRQVKLAKQMDTLSVRLAATRAVFETAPSGLYLVAQRRSGGGEAIPEGRTLSLNRADRTSVSAELAMRVAETEINLNVLRYKKEETDRQVTSLTLLSERVEAGDLDLNELVREDTSGMLTEVQPRASILQSATTSAQSSSRRAVFKALLAMFAGFLLSLIAAGVREAVQGRQFA